MIFTLEVLPANEGDCLLLHWGTPAAPRLAVIDGGPGRIFEEHLGPRLKEIADARAVKPLTLDLVMVSHADSDHIIGIKKLLRKIRKGFEDQAPVASRIKAKRLWHNTFNDVIGDKVGTYYQQLEASYTASVNGEENPQIAEKLETKFKDKGESGEEAAHEAIDIAKLLAGHGEGREVRDDHKFLHDQGEILQLNYPFKTAQGNPTLIMRGAAHDRVKVDGADFRLFAPAKAEIDALQKEFDDYIEDKGLSVEAVLAAYADKSAKNLSSIVCLAEVDGHTILFTGDARGDHVLEGLKAGGALDAQGKLHVDVLKVPHHGSEHNAAPDFFKAISADVYVISANGRYENPDRATVEWLIASRAKNDEYEIVFTYPIQDINRLRKEVREGKGKSWKKAKDSLQVVLDEKSAAGYKFTFVEEAPHSIHLGDEEPD